MPQFIFIELPSFRVKDKNGHSVSLSGRHLGRMIAQLQYLRSALRPGGEYGVADLSASLLFGQQETSLWTASATAAHHAEENLLLAYFHSFDSPGAYPIVDGLLLGARPCGACADYFALAGRPLQPRDDGTGTGAMTAAAPFRAKFTPRVDRTYTPVFYLARGLDDAQRAGLWLQLGQMCTGDLAAMGAALLPPAPAAAASSSSSSPAGEAYYLFDDGTTPWYALNGQENMTDAEIAEAISRQQMSPTYWIGR
ncbi:hypothetical protein SAMD00023353_1501570 [Rosellinia necatrix]|uniref:Uncharacterized protein n=1 Tax=Rosellinia necatrix TaxID=77044 RepID=A0A1W2TIS8_ROSNE|nr:hypothetical protein SAMD00023353_1501570 [Rosellinia necatrix]